MLCWTGWPSTITDDCTRLWVTSVRCNMSNTGTQHSEKSCINRGLRTAQLRGKVTTTERRKPILNLAMAMQHRKWMQGLWDEATNFDLPVKFAANHPP